MIIYHTFKEEFTDSKDWFDENSIESTVSIQYSEMPGMVWVDTPGFGAIEKKAIDIRPLEEIAKEYVKYADLVIFLANSASPGNQDEIKAYEGLYHAGKKALAILTRSDTTNEDIDDNGNLVNKRVPKDAKRRNDQEKYLLTELSNLGVPKKDCSAISISTLLAEEAVDEQDSEKWVGSNIGILLRKIGDIISSQQILSLKQKGPSEQLLQCLDRIIDNTKDENDKSISLQILLKSISNIKDEMKKKYDELNPSGHLTREIIENIVAQIRRRICKLVESKANTSSELSDISLDSLSTHIVDTFNEQLTYEVKNIIGEYHKAERKFDIRGINTTIKREYKEYTQTYDVPYSVKRSPEGIIENIKGFFGKTYYTTKTRSETKQFKIDNGFDTQSAIQQLTDSLQDTLIQNIRAELSELREKFFGGGIQKLEQLVKKETIWRRFV